jgi:DNA polymerase-1
MEQRGVGTNPEFCERKVELGEGRMETISRQLHLNPASPKDLGTYLIEELDLPVVKHTPSCEMCAADFPVDTHEGKPSFDKHAIAEYDELLAATNNTAAKLITEFRGWQKAVSSLYKPALEKVGPDGLIRTEFKQHGTITGRLSSHDPNLQQIPRTTDKRWNGDAKSAFNSGRGNEFALYGWDYSQLELRISAAYGNETLLLEEFEKPDSDVFSVLAPRVFGVLTPDTRHYTKNGFVYPTLYGAGLKKIAYTINKSMAETEPLLRNYQASIPGIMGVSSKVTQLVAERGYVRYWDGRRRHIKNRRESYKAWNSVCQGGAAQLVKQAMLRIEKLEDENFFMVLQVHDEITFAIRRDMISHYEPAIVEAMTDFPIFNVHLAVEGKEWK